LSWIVPGYQPKALPGRVVENKPTHPGGDDGRGFIDLGNENKPVLSNASGYACAVMRPLEWAVEFQRRTLEARSR